MAMSFTPDGYLVAAADWNRVLIWNAEAGGVPKFTWKGASSKLPSGMLTNGNGVSEEDDSLEADAECSLSWDAESGKLALGLKSVVCTPLSSNFMRRRLMLANRLQSLTYGIEEYNVSQSFLVLVRC